MLKSLTIYSINETVKIHINFILLEINPIWWIFLYIVMYIYACNDPTIVGRTPLNSFKTMWSVENKEKGNCRPGQMREDYYFIPNKYDIIWVFFTNTVLLIIIILFCYQIVLEKWAGSIFQERMCGFEQVYQLCKN